MLSGENYAIIHQFEKNAFIRRENVSILDKNEDKDERARIVSKKRYKSRVADLENKIQHFKAKAYYNQPNDQRYINTGQEKFDVLE